MLIITNLMTGAGMAGGSLIQQALVISLAVLEVVSEALAAIRMGLALKGAING